MNAENLAKLEKEAAAATAEANSPKKMPIKESDRYRKNAAFADIRVKLGDQNIHEQESLPSEISANAWDELPKYEAMKLKHDMIKERENKILKKKQVMSTLDQQVLEHRKQKIQAQLKIQEMD